jgi:hypothetical protein
VPSEPGAQNPNDDGEPKQCRQPLVRFRRPAINALDQLIELRSGRDMPSSDGDRRTSSVDTGRKSGKVKSKK